MASDRNPNHNHAPGLYRLIRALVKLFYPRTAVVGAEALPGRDCVIVGNHTQMNGPIVSELYIPGEHFTWCAAEMMTLSEVPAYAYSDFWSQKPRYIRWFYRLLSYIIAPLSVCVFNNARTIPVYHDTRIVTTFRETIARLDDGAGIVIFPEYDAPYNHILYAFRDKFVDVARFYHKRTGRALSFVPMYVAPALKTVYFGEPVVYDPAASPAAERERICAALMEAITAMACSLPRHTVVPYRNIPKRLYPANIPASIPGEEASHEPEAL